MAKKINAETQGNSYLNSLLGQRTIVPLDHEEEVVTGNTVIRDEIIPEVKDKQAAPTISQKLEAVPEKSTVIETEQQVYRQTGPGRRRAGMELKVRGSFAIEPSVFRNFKKVAYINHEKISNIIEDYIIRYVELHKEEIEEFDKLPESVRMRADI